MAERSADSYSREVRDTIVKSGLSGVAATVMAVTVFSPAGFGGMIGASLASGFGFDPNTAPADNPYANLPAFPTPLSAEEVDDIRAELASTEASLEITRAATEAKIERMRSLSLADASSFTPMPAQPAALTGGLRLETTDPTEIATPTPPEATVRPASYGGGGVDPSQYRDPHLELAELLLAHERF